MSVPEAPLVDNGSGLAPAGAGWFVVNARAAQWLVTEGGDAKPSGSECPFESGAAPFAQLGMRLHVLSPGECNGLYHREDAQEGFLLVAGECILLIEGEQRRLRAWDFVHCPAGTEHIFVGAGDGPCAIVMVGARGDDENIVYPVSELAARHDASAHVETTDPDQAYIPRFEPSRRGRPSYWERLPWA